MIVLSRFCPGVIGAFHPYDTGQQRDKKCRKIDIFTVKRY